jgi:hypothetical protein
MASFYRYDQMNRLKKVQSFDHSNHQGTAWDAYTADDRYQMQLTYDMNGNILTLKRNGNDANNLKMDDFNYNYYALNSSNSPIDIQLTGYNGNSTNLVTNRLSKLEEDINLAPNYDADIDGLSPNGNVNYSYDALGNLTQDLSEEIEEIKWNAYGKVVEVLRTSTCQDKPDLVYVYDAFGQRIKKIVKKRTAGILSHEKDWQETYYVRDAQGNVMAMYNHTSAFFANNNNYVSESFSISEWNLYGSSRLGTRNIDKEADVVFLASRNYNWIGNAVTNEVIAPTASFTYKKYRVLGAKTFELTNHLSNVITTISDRKLMIEDASNTGYVHHYLPEILSIGEQYAFGMSMPGRTFSVEKYRYGMNTQEKDDEIFEGAFTAEYWEYDSRVGRRWNLDPINQTGVSNYACFYNNPNTFVDPNGALSRNWAGFISKVLHPFNKGRRIKSFNKLNLIKASPTRTAAAPSTAPAPAPTRPGTNPPTVAIPAPPGTPPQAPQNGNDWFTITFHFKIPIVSDGLSNGPFVLPVINFNLGNNFINGSGRQLNNEVRSGGQAFNARLAQVTARLASEGSAISGYSVNYTSVTIIGNDAGGTNTNYTYIDSEGAMGTYNAPAVPYTPNTPNLSNRNSPSGPALTPNVNQSLQIIKTPSGAPAQADGCQFFQVRLNVTFTFTRKT